MHTILKRENLTPYHVVMEVPATWVYYLWGVKPNAVMKFFAYTRAYVQFVGTRY